MTRSSQGTNLQYNPEIERTARQLRKETREGKRRLENEAEIDLTTGGTSIFTEIEEKMADLTDAVNPVAASDISGCDPANRLRRNPEDRI